MMDQTSFAKVQRPPGAFLQTSYDKNDTLGKSLLTWYLMKSGHTVNVPKENFGIDMTSTKDGKQYHWEVEMKASAIWTGEADFPYPTVSFLKRKAKMGDNFWYAIICKDTQALVMARSTDIFKDEYKENVNVNTSDRQGVDEFYRVPKSKCLWKNGKDMV